MIKIPRKDRAHGYWHSTKQKGGSQRRKTKKLTVGAKRRTTYTPASSQRPTPDIEAGRKNDPAPNPQRPKPHPKSPEAPNPKK